MSDDKKGLLYPAKWSDRITDIHEQYPLLDVDLCLAIAEKMGIDYNNYSRHDAPHILTSDFMLTVTRDGKDVIEARTFKPSKELKIPQRVLNMQKMVHNWAGQSSFAMSP
jgi:hypothetical protein